MIKNLRTVLASLWMMSVLDCMWLLYLFYYLFENFLPLARYTHGLIVVFVRCVSIIAVRLDIYEEVYVEIQCN